jgi:hypothetical protein
MVDRLQQRSENRVMDRPRAGYALQQCVMVASHSDKPISPHNIELPDKIAANDSYAYSLRLGASESGLRLLLGQNSRSCAVVKSLHQVLQLVGWEMSAG